MQSSLNIARLVGPILSAIGIGMLANQATYREMATQFLAGLPFIYFSGVLMLLAGLAILNVHNDWTPDWRSTVTVIGWVLDLRRHVPYHCAAVRQFRRELDHRQCRLFHRPRHLPASRSAAL